MPAITEIGAASPRAQGQAMTKTAIEVNSIKSSFGSGPKLNQISAVITATINTMGTNQLDTLSANRASRGLVFCAAFTHWMIWNKVVCWPTRVALNWKFPVLLIVPAYT